MKRLLVSIVPDDEYSVSTKRKVIVLQLVSTADLEVLASSGIPEALAGRIADGALPPDFVAKRALRHLQSGKAATWCATYYIVRQEDRFVIGSCGFKDVPINGQVEIGYGVSPACRNQGFATDAVDSLCRLAFTCEDVRAVLAQVSPTNLSSRRVVEKLNFHRGELKPDDDGEMLVQWVSRRTSGPASGANTGGVARIGEAH